MDLSNLKAVLSNLTISLRFYIPGYPYRLPFFQVCQWLTSSRKIPRFSSSWSSLSWAVQTWISLVIFWLNEWAETHRQLVRCQQGCHLWLESFSWCHESSWFPLCDRPKLEWVVILFRLMPAFSWIRAPQDPAHDLQAMDRRATLFTSSFSRTDNLSIPWRAFRFGQTHDVSVYRLLGAGSVEELIYARQIYKQQQMEIGYNASIQTRSGIT